MEKSIALGSLKEALKKLANEASGFLAMADPRVHGFTNMRVLQDRIDMARAAIQSAEENSLRKVTDASSQVVETKEFAPNYTGRLTQR